MIKSSLNMIASFFVDYPKGEEAVEFFNELVLMTLARATSADTNIHPVEVELVRTKLKEVTGQDVSTADIHVAANSELFERASLESVLIRISTELAISQKLLLVSALYDIIKADERVSQREVTFFNMVASALRITPADLIGLQVENAS